MSSYLSNLLTSTTSKYNTLRRQLLSDDADGDTEDDSHISRVLRAYYLEKGRPFPPWLPPDPKAPMAAPAQMVSSARGPGQPQMGRGGGLSDIWDPQPPPPQQQESASLRRQPGRPGPGRQLQARQPGMNDRLSPEPQAAGRPLPSQRAGSFQSTGSGSSRPSLESTQQSSSGPTAQERLKQRLWGSGRSTSPSQNSSTNSSPMATPQPTPGGRNPYERPGSQSTQSGRLPYPDDRNSGGYSGGGGRQPAPRPQQQQQSSYGMSANAIWTDNGDPYGGGGGWGAGGGGSSGGGQQQRSGAGGRVGLPSGPRMRSS